MGKKSGGGGRAPQQPGQNAFGDMYGGGSSGLTQNGVQAQMPGQGQPGQGQPGRGFAKYPTPRWGTQNGVQAQMPPGLTQNGVQAQLPSSGLTQNGVQAQLPFRSPQMNPQQVLEMQAMRDRFAEQYSRTPRQGLSPGRGPTPAGGTWGTQNGVQAQSPIRGHTAAPQGLTQNGVQAQGRGQSQPQYTQKQIADYLQSRQGGGDISPPTPAGGTWGQSPGQSPTPAGGTWGTQNGVQAQMPGQSPTPAGGTWGTQNGVQAQMPTPAGGTWGQSPGGTPTPAGGTWGTQNGVQAQMPSPSRGGGVVSAPVQQAGADYWTQDRMNKAKPMSNNQVVNNTNTTRSSPSGRTLVYQ
jgi:hypothetical protein